MKEKQVLISKKLFMALLKYFFADEMNQEDEIKKELQKKLDKMAEHEKYTLKLKEEKDSPLL